MAFELNLHITGLCAFKPKTALTNRSNSCTVFLPNARFFLGPRDPEPHRPVWIVEEQYVAKGSRSANSVVRKDEAHPKFFVYDLDLNAGLLTKESDVQGNGSKLKLGRNWTIEPTGADKVEFNLSATPPDRCPVEANRQDFRWVAPLEKIQPGAGTIKPIALSSNPGHNGVTSRVELAEGKLFVRQFASEDGNPNKRPIKWIFKSESGRSEFESAIAEVVTLTRSVESADSVVKLVPDRWIDLGQNPSPDDSILLKPIDGKVELWLKNQPYDDFLGDPLGASKKDHHFAAFYTLSKDPGDRKLPCRNLFCGMESEQIHPSSVGNPQCPGTRFEP